MIGIVPLAGPDFERADGTVKAEYVVDGLPLLRRALESRSWWLSGGLRAQDLIFVLHDSLRSRRFAEEKIARWYPGCRRVYLSDFAAGAALSVAAAVALVKDYDEPLAVDLCDILFDCDATAVARFGREPEIGGLAVVFAADDPKYSYLVCDASGLMTRAREKQVISRNASVGAYFFRSSRVYLQALAHSMAHCDTLAHHGLIYVCPLLNGVVALGLDVECVAATSVRDIRLPAAK
jgi:hypothetical protein